MPPSPATLNNDARDDAARVCGPGRSRVPVAGDVRGPTQLHPTGQRLRARPARIAGASRRRRWPGARGAQIDRPVAGGLDQAPAQRPGQPVRLPLPGAVPAAHPPERPRPGSRVRSAAGAVDATVTLNAGRFLAERPVPRSGVRDRLGSTFLTADTPRGDAQLGLSPRTSRGVLVLQYPRRSGHGGRCAYRSVSLIDGFATSD